MKIAVGVTDAVLGTVALTPRGLQIDGPEKEALTRLVREFRSTSRDDEEVLWRMLDRFQGYTWAAEVDEGEPGQAAAPGTKAGAGGVGPCPIEIDDSWLDAGGR